MTHDTRPDTPQPDEPDARARRLLDAVIDHLLRDELDRSEALTASQARVADLEADVAVYRELVIASFDALRALTVAHDRRREELERSRDECRWLREELLQGDADVAA